MIHQRRPLEAGDVLNSNVRRKNHIESTAKRLVGYYADNDKKQRKSQGLCRYCYYFANDRIGGSAITRVNCRGCDKELSFGNTCTDDLCLKCSAVLKLCKHCIGRMD